MLRLAIACFVLAVIAAVLGFGGMAGTFAWLAHVFFVGFLIVAVILGVVSLTKVATKKV